MASFPTLSSGQPCQHPLRRTISFRTQVTRFLDDSEQRYPCRPPLHSLDVQLKHLSKTDRDTVITFWQDQRGALTKSWDFTVDNVIYRNCAFTEEGLDFQEYEWPERYNLALRLRQTASPSVLITTNAADAGGGTLLYCSSGHGLPPGATNYSISVIGGTGAWGTAFNGIHAVTVPDATSVLVSTAPAGAVAGSPYLRWVPTTPGDFPVVRTTTARFQRPYQVSRRIRLARTDNPDSGLHYASSLNETTHCTPAHVGCYTWRMGYYLRASEALALECHFMNCQGRVERFAFVDSDGNTHAHCRYGSDDLVLEYRGPDDLTAQVEIQEEA